jgi:polyisoprenoid-binding protein YceI
MNIHRTARFASPFIPQLMLALALTSASACKSEIDEKPKAKVEEAGKKAPDAGKTDPTKTDPAKAAVELNLDKATSKVGFIGGKVTADHPGSFTDVSGTAKVADGKLQSLDIVVEMASLSSEPIDLQNHLKGADFFDVEKFPQAKFSVLEVTEKAGEGGATHEIAGNLEMHGQTKKVTFPATITVSETSVDGKAEFKIDRNDWGISYAGMKDDLIKAEVALILDLHFKRA